MKSPASRKSAERQRRKDAGEVRVETWCSLEQISVLDLDPISRANAVKVLIDKERERHEEDASLLASENVC